MGDAVCQVGGWQCPQSLNNKISFKKLYCIRNGIFLRAKECMGTAFLKEYFLMHYSYNY